MALLPEASNSEQYESQRVATLLLADFVTAGLKSLLTIEAYLKALGGFS